MGKHNGKSRNKGLMVGSALLRRKMGGGGGGRHKTQEDASSRHTTELMDGSGSNMQSIVEMNDLDELMNMATLAERDFTADRYEPVVIQMGATQCAPKTAEEKSKLEEEHRHRLTVPRRPPWTKDMTVAELELQERGSFLEWRRTIAVAEEESGLSVTPFEKNIEVWRQLWRVLERSHVVAQVVDGRNPLFYYCEDLQQYALDLQPPRQTVLILNKADLLTLEHRKEWARYFGERGIKHCFFSAKLEDPNPYKRPQAQEDEPHDSAESGFEDPGVKVHTREEMIERLEHFALESLESAGIPDPRLREDKPTRLSVGLVGYPNVGKSSTINALKGEKKTVVSSTPGKTKHFQTLNVSDDVCICDCPGLVFPRFAESRSYMVVSGVLPIDKLTNDVRGPLDIVASHFHKDYLARFYHVELESEEGKPPHKVSGRQLAEAYAVVRGLILQGGRADEMKSGRKILKDYIDGKLCYCHPPPGVTHLKQRSDLALEGAGIPSIGALEHEDGEEEVVQRLENFSELGSGKSPGGNNKHGNQRRRPDHKYKKNSRKKKHGHGGHVQADGGMAIGRKGGVIRISSNY
ncbi:P-loop-containing nucleoside triphosphate hydrolase [Chloropicon primus]|uniref:P-loop-containing nucleoside triphosphate hydrolase n=1 Tax=Chloropicon primus TaxID=1764295 RepID=A0A5B8MC54_9CHLO|nr:P-loop-containing nucleoside triphosphate hydrolase [Chloropicon primus]UPQ97260.1 P-loop-containing nucleoside triphosphate hydrolase [Chloropicon primus]|eukprot:QDZ18046.1 P-loop-containing nucleoside triphosphate hydrolase [Chloropicon primus]